MNDEERLISRSMNQRGWHNYFHLNYSFVCVKTENFLPLSRSALQHNDRKAMFRKGISFMATVLFEVFGDVYC